jgi:hypothetical protein
MNFSYERETDNSFLFYPFGVSAIYIQKSHQILVNLKKLRPVSHPVFKFKFYQSSKQLLNLKCGEKTGKIILYQNTIWESTNYIGLKVGEANFMPISKQTFRS